jgi:hypothetical protein
MRRKIGSLEDSGHPSVARFALFAHLMTFIRPRQYTRRNRQADLLGGFQIDNELELLRLLNWQIGGPRTLQDFVDIRRSARRNKSLMFAP